MKWYLIWPIIIFLVSCCDLGVTLYFDRTCDYFEEANPIALYIWENLGDAGLIIIKLTVTLASCIFTGWALRYKNRSWRVAVSIFGLTVCCVLIGWWIFWIFS
jgi:hypothetical protein